MGGLDLDKQSSRVFNAIKIWFVRTCSIGKTLTPPLLTWVQNVACSSENWKRAPISAFPTSGQSSSDLSFLSRIKTIWRSSMLTSVWWRLLNVYMQNLCLFRNQLKNFIIIIMAHLPTQRGLNELYKIQGVVGNDPLWQEKTSQSYELWSLP